MSENETKGDKAKVNKADQPLSQEELDAVSGGSYYGKNIVDAARKILNKDGSQDN